MVPDYEALRSLATSSLLARCTEDLEDSAAWREFVRRLNPVIRDLVRMTLRQRGIGPDQEHDHRQNVIVRLVEHDCVVLRRFTGTSDEQLRAYLAVITRSVITDFCRRQGALKRPVADNAGFVWDEIPEAAQAGAKDALERTLLSSELIDIGMRLIERDSGEAAGRDRLIFFLYYKKGLSGAEIAQSRGIGLNRRAVSDVISRLTDRVRLAAHAGSSEVRLG